MNAYLESNTAKRCDICRLISWVLALLIAPFAGVVVLLLAPFIFLETRANPIFIQTRVGKDLKPFKLYKLRSIKSGAPSVATHKLDETQVTKLGRLLRKMKLDEIPQILNVLNGTMSLVGPRPALPGQETLNKAREKIGVASLYPGITGWSQIKRLDMSDESSLVKSDFEYLQQQSVFLDFKILAKTLIGNGSGDRVNIK